MRLPSPHCMLAVALHTCIELFRDRIFASVLLFAALIIVATTGVEYLTIGTERDRLLVDMGMAAMVGFTYILVFFVGALLLLREFQERTITIIFSKPIPRSHFILGKFLGVAVIFFCLLVGFGALLLALWWWQGVAVSSIFYTALLLLYAESLFVLSMVLFLSTLLSPLLTIVMSVLLFLAGSMLPALDLLLTQRSDTSLQLFGWLYYLVPNFGIFHMGDLVSTSHTLSGMDIATLLLYGACYTSIFLIGTSLLIHRREL